MRSTVITEITLIITYIFKKFEKGRRICYEAQVLRILYLPTMISRWKKVKKKTSIQVLIKTV